MVELTAEKLLSSGVQVTLRSWTPTIKNVPIGGSYFITPLTEQTAFSSVGVNLCGNVIGIGDFHSIEGLPVSTLKVALVEISWKR